MRSAANWAASRATCWCSNRARRMTTMWPNCRNDEAAANKPSGSRAPTPPGPLPAADKGNAMSDDLTFYTNPMSRGRIVRWMLEEVGAPYQTQILDYATTLKGPEYLAINPMGKVPAIKHGEVVVTEAAAICAYLADAFPQAGLAPPVGDKQR